MKEKDENNKSYMKTTDEYAKGRNCERPGG